MRTASSSSGLKPAAEAAGAALPAELAPVVIIAPPGPESELLLRLLDSHPAIYARAEDTLDAALPADELGRSLHMMASSAVRDASMSLRRGVACPLRAVCVTIDPRAAEGIDRLARAVPDLRAVCLLRDGRDAIVADRMASLRAGEFGRLSPAARASAVRAAASLADPGAAPSHLFCPESLRLHTSRWIASLRGPLRAMELLGEGSARLIRFEDLLREPTRVHAATCRWLGVAGDAALIHSAVEAGRAQLAAAARPGAWRTHFAESDIIGFKRMAGELLIELGYEQSTQW